ncbi:hypothetical protein SAMN05444169_8274 [Bradyrhizobium erythrophlei]|uniref:Uncharacterized protein n=1 Tax=Bradyrhizobium erythrophlei TaxID=1437360 RepID=A0A1M5UAF0_9BRAD|nr:hypothetical protein SAMN05444169_8274 [Bradyrhizobium erythrophlei]
MATRRSQCSWGISCWASPLLTSNNEANSSELSGAGDSWTIYALTRKSMLRRMMPGGVPSNS